MPDYLWRCTTPDCPHRGCITRWLNVSIANYRTLPHPVCDGCGKEKKRVIEPIALSPARETEGKA